MKQLPRYDPQNNDLSISKPSLAMLYNVTLTESWSQSSLKKKIFLGEHNVECGGAVRDARYRDTKTGQYDGVHLLGSSGQKALTLSILNVLENAHITSSVYNSRVAIARARHQQNPRKPFRNPAFFSAGLRKSRNPNSVSVQNRFDVFNPLQGN